HALDVLDAELLEHGLRHRHGRTLELSVLLEAVRRLACEPDGDLAVVDGLLQRRLVRVASTAGAEGERQREARCRGGQSFEFHVLFLPWTSTHRRDVRLLDSIQY